MYENQFNAARWEAAEQLFLNAGTILYRIMSGVGMRINGRTAYFAREHSPNVFYQWLCGTDFRYKFRDGKMHVVTIDTLKDALLSQSCSKWVADKTVVHTTEYKPQEKPESLMVTAYRAGYEAAAAGKSLDSHNYISNLAKTRFELGFLRYFRDKTKEAYDG